MRGDAISSSAKPLAPQAQGNEFADPEAIPLNPPSFRRGK
ncbi:MAG: hypothetical protein OJF61_000545 [Rhodanobacteraceae bacterium]|nr:MAG: hypothetical protein OJF61_000545 [Rhodanobacteraceae bacterium]